MTIPSPQHNGCFPLLNYFCFLYVFPTQSPPLDGGQPPLDQAPTIYFNSLGISNSHRELWEQATHPLVGTGHHAAKCPTMHRDSPSLAKNYPAQDVNGAEVEPLVYPVALLSHTHKADQRVYCFHTQGSGPAATCVLVPKYLQHLCRKSIPLLSLKTRRASRLPLADSMRSCSGCSGCLAHLPCLLSIVHSSHLPPASVCVSLTEGFLRSGEVTLPPRRPEGLGNSTPWE